MHPTGSPEHLSLRFPQVWSASVVELDLYEPHTALVACSASLGPVVAISLYGLTAWGPNTQAARRCVVICAWIDREGPVAPGSRLIHGRCCHCKMLARFDLVRNRTYHCNPGRDQAIPQLHMVCQLQNAIIVPWLALAGRLIAGQTDWWKCSSADLLALEFPRF